MPTNFVESCKDAPNIQSHFSWTPHSWARVPSYSGALLDDSSGPHEVASDSLRHSSPNIASSQYHSSANASYKTLHDPPPNWQPMQVGGHKSPWPRPPSGAIRPPMDASAGHALPVPWPRPASCLGLQPGGIWHVPSGAAAPRPGGSAVWASRPVGLGGGGLGDSLAVGEAGQRTSRRKQQAARDQRSSRQSRAILNEEQASPERVEVGRRASARDGMRGGWHARGLG